MTSANTTLAGEFQWLTSWQGRLRAIVDIHKQTPSSKIEEKLRRLLTEAQTLNLTLPESFIRFMGSPAHHARKRPNPGHDNYGNCLRHIAIN